jgi:hypothetical protein
MDGLSTVFQNDLVLGENGHPLAKWNDTLLTLFFNLNRGVKNEDLEDAVQQIFMDARCREDVESIKNLCLLVFQTRSCRDGKGERCCSYGLMYYIWKESPQVVFELLPLMPEFGYWKDPLAFLQFVHWQVSKANLQGLKTETIERKVEALEFVVYTLYANQLRKDNLCQEDSKLSLAAKYAPTEGGSYSKKMESNKKICEKLFGGKLPEHKKKYRILLTKLRNRLKLVETKMCNGQWREISVKAMPSRAMALYKRAMLMEGKNKKIQETEDRIACRQNVIRHIENGGSFHGKQVYPHELVHEAQNLPEEAGLLEKIINAQWDNMMSGLKKETEAFQNNFVTMCDVSGSMMSGSMKATPMDVSIGLGIAMSELQKEEKFKDVLTFTDKPDWHKINPEDGFVAKVKSLKRANWGWNTNFYLALKRILELSKECVEDNFKPPNLLVISDMQFDVAAGDGNGEEWNVAMENIKKEFTDAGLSTPIIVFWNVSSSTKMPSRENKSKDVIYMSGYSTALFKFLLFGDLESVGTNSAVPEKKITPQEMLSRVLNDPHLDPVRVALEKIDKVSFLGVDS